MKIYFTAAISQLDEYKPYFIRIVNTILGVGHSLQYKHILEVSLEDVLNASDNHKIEYYKKFLHWVTEADVVVVEASFPSTVHIGHEISIALEKGKPVILLYKKGKAPVFLEGIVSDKLLIQEYDETNLESMVKSSIRYATDQQDTRFNFFVSPRISSYLDWVSKKKRLPRAVYLRRLIEEDMKKNRDYEE